jgi:hypothetical protein
MADLEGLCQHNNLGSDEVIVPLLGRFKGENHAKQHLLILCATTGSGIRIKLWLGRSTGPAFCELQGFSVNPAHQI